MLRKRLESELLKIIESVPDNLLSNFAYLKQRIAQHFGLTEMGHRLKFRNLVEIHTTVFRFFGKCAMGAIKLVESCKSY